LLDPSQRAIKPVTGADRPVPLLRPQFSVVNAALARAGMVDWARNDARLADEFRIVQGQILQKMALSPAAAPAQDNIIMVTSARPGEGKSFSSLNLAGSLASCSLRPVILVDADIKRHTLTTALGLAGREGLLNLAADLASDDADMLVATAIPLLRIMPIGLRVPKDATISGRTLLNTLSHCARQHADSLIVLDTAPCLSSSEPSTLASLAGHIVMVVEAQQTQRAELEAALRLVSACPSVALMLNKVQINGSDTFGAYGY